MVHPLTVYGDAQAALAEAVRAALAAESAPWAQDARVGTRVPTGAEPYAKTGPFVVVTQNAPGTAQKRANFKAPIRVLVWHLTDDDAYDLTVYLHAVVLNHSGPTVRSVNASLGPSVTADPDTGEPMGSFSVTANVRGRAH